MMEQYSNHNRALMQLATANNIHYDSCFKPSLHAWRGLGRYEIEFAHLATQRGGRSYLFYVPGEMERCFGAIFDALNDAELDDDESLLAKAIKKTEHPDRFFENLDNIGRFLDRIHPQDGAKILAYIADELQSGHPVRQVDRDFWSQHLDGVKNAPTPLDWFRWTRRSQHGHVVVVELMLSPEDTVHHHSPFDANEIAPPTVAVSAAQAAEDDALVIKTYKEELRQLALDTERGTARVAQDYEGVHKRDLEARLAAARAKAQEHFDAAHGRLPSAGKHADHNDAPVREGHRPSTLEV